MKFIFWLKITQLSVEINSFCDVYHYFLLPFYNTKLYFVDHLSIIFI